MTSEHITTAICFIVMFGFLAFAVYMDRRREAPDDIRAAADRLEAAAKRVEKQQVASSPLWSFTRTITENYWVATCKHCKKKNRVKSEDLRGARCGACGLPFNPSPSLRN